MNATREQLQESIADLDVAMRDELDRYLAAVEPLREARWKAAEELAFLEWRESIPVEERIGDA